MKFEAHPIFVLRKKKNILEGGDGIEKEINPR